MCPNKSFLSGKSCFAFQFFTELQLFRKKSEEDSMYSATEDATPDEESALDASQASELMLVGFEPFID